MSTERLAVVTPKFVFGLFVLVAGVLLTVDNLDLAETAGLFRFWPVALIAMGAVMLTQAHEGNGRVGSVVLMLVGGWLLLNTLDVIDVRFWELFWPLILVVTGTTLIMQAFRPRRRAPLHASGVFKSFAVMSGVKRTSGASRFRHADLGSIMGDCYLDLRQATIPTGEEAVVEVFALMGANKIRVPEEWLVDSRVFALMGGVEDKTTPPADASAPRLVVHGAVIMGGLHLTN